MLSLGVGSAAIIRWCRTRLKMPRVACMHDQVAVLPPDICKAFRGIFVNQWTGKAERARHTACWQLISTISSEDSCQQVP
jgi:hypothetical protein